MAQDATLQGLRNQLLTQIHGRRLALDPNDYLVGPKELRTQISGFTTPGTTIVSTSVASNIDPYGVTVLGATLASGTTLYTLAAPVPGVRKTLFCPTTGYAVVGTTVGGAFICSTGSAASTYGYITFAGKGGACELLGLTTSLWGVVGTNAISTGGAAVTFV